MKLYWGWVVCICFLSLFTMTVGLVFTYSLLMVPINMELHTSLTLLEWLGGLQIGLPMLGAPIATMIYYRMGAITTVMIGVLGTSMSFALAALSPNIGVLFIALGVLASCFMTLIVNPPFYLLDDYFPYEHPRHVLATSVVACGFPLATLVFNPLAIVIVEAVGWRITYSIYAIIFFVFGSGFTLTFLPAKSIDGDTKTLTEKKAYEDIPLSNVSIHRRTKLVLSTIWFFASFFKTMGYYTPFMTLANQLESMGIEPSKAATTMSVVGICELFSRVITSYIGDYIKGKILHAYVVFTFLLAVQNALGSFADTYTQVTLYAAALGTLGGPIIAAIYSSSAEVLQGEDVPALFSIFRVGLGLGGMFGPVLAGAIFDATDSFLNVYYVNCATYMLTSLLYLSVILLNKYRPKLVFPEGPVTHQRFMDDVDDAGDECIMMERVRGESSSSSSMDEYSKIEGCNKIHGGRTMDYGASSFDKPNLQEQIDTLDSTAQRVLQDYNRHKKARNETDDETDHLQG